MAPEAYLAHRVEVKSFQRLGASCCRSSDLDDWSGALKNHHRETPFVKETKWQELAQNTRSSMSAFKNSVCQKTDKIIVTLRGKNTKNFNTSTQEMILFNIQHEGLLHA